VTSSVAVFEAAIWVKINVYNKIVMKNKKKRKHGNQTNLYITSSKRRFWNGIHSWLRRADARGSADTIYCM